MYSEWHLLYEGYLSDAPGRSESWTESVRYVGGGAWRLLSEGTDFDGADAGVVFRERLSTKGMLDWALARDAEDAESERLQSAARSDEDNDSDGTPAAVVLGPRATRLLEIADQVGSTLCARCLRGFAAGTWPPAPRPPVIRQITGVALRPVWIRISHPVFTASTSAGPAFLYPPSTDGRAQLVLTSSRSMDKGWTIRLPRKWLLALEPWKDELAQLSKARSGGRQPQAK